ncbi:alpha/beta-hydrolase [Epithele typhae]|uniref:alpha/beta-hydrolase n=1 Tax=Epithele typhae TaxID=378194 RepID=UPI0020084A49|nr:alpha/beta-hydrolase [Epithele typhae]KAH9928523.1 alpha/beta-hydrolase [Epithele typhae]
MDLYPERSVLERQPLKALYLAFHVASILARTPYWSLRFLVPSLRPHPAWTYKRALIVRVLQAANDARFDLTLMPGIAGAVVPPSEKGLDKYNARLAWIEALEKDDPLVCGEVKVAKERAGVESVRVPGYWTLKKGSEWADKARPGEKTMLHIHSGGFYLCSAHPSDVSANFMRAILEHTSAERVSRTLSVDYRLSAAAPHFAPANPFPAALLDVLAAYRHLVRDLGFDPANVVLSGHSAGGGLALAVARHFVENRAALAAAGYAGVGAVVLGSAWMDPGMTLRGPESSIERNRGTDMFPPGYLPQPPRVHAEYAVTAYRGPMSLEEAARNRYVAAASRLVEPAEGRGLFAGFPRTYLSAGGVEKLLDSSLVVAERMEADGVEVVLDVEPHAIHDFIMFPWHEPERSSAAKRIAHWIEG